MRNLLAILVMLGVLVAPSVPALGLAHVPTRPPVVEQPHNEELPAPAEDRPDGREQSSTHAPPSVGLTPRVESFESLERCLRLPTEFRTPRLDHDWQHFDRARQKQRRIQRVVLLERANTTALRILAPCVRSHAPPIA